jgi:hypothetical protein
MPRVVHARDALPRNIPRNIAAAHPILRCGNDASWPHPFYPIWVNTDAGQFARVLIADFAYNATNKNRYIFGKGRDMRIAAHSLRL